MCLYPESVYEEVITTRQTTLHDLLRAALEAESTYDKGKSLENLSVALFGSPYLKFIRSNILNAESEVDLLFGVKQFQGTIFQNFPDRILIECKNWNSKPGAKEIRDFVGKMADYGTTMGFYVSKFGLTGDDQFKTAAKGEIKRKWDQSESIVLTFTLDEIKDIIACHQNLYRMMESKYIGFPAFVSE